MGLINKLEQIVDEEGKTYVSSLRSAAKIIYDIIGDYEDPKPFIVLTHLADADGLGSQAVLVKGIQLFAQYMGNTSVNVINDRVMELSADENDDESINKVLSRYGMGQNIFADIATTPLEKASELGNPIIIDHHPIGSQSIDGCTVVNPYLSGISGDEQLSGAIGSTYVLHAILDLFKEEFDDGSDQIKASMKVLESKLNYLSLIGLAGGIADQQKNTGLNKPLFEHLEQRGLLKTVNVPFYGFHTKDLSKIIAESSIPFNLKYKVASPSAIRHLLGTMDNGFDLRSCNELIDKYQSIFVMKYQGKTQKPLLGINKQVLDSLNSKEIFELETLVQSSCHRDLDTLVSEAGIVFEDFEDDLKRRDERIDTAKKCYRRISDLGDMSSNGIVTLEMLSGEQIEEFKELYKENISAFCDPLMIKHYLGMLNEPQFIITEDRTELLKQNSLSEIANLMTALSKLGKGGAFLSAVDSELYNLDSSDPEVSFDIARVRDIKKQYDICVYEGLRRIEVAIYGDSTKLEQISDFVFMLPLDFLKNDLDINLRSMTGVYGGVTAATRHLPGNYGVLLTSYQVGEGMYKVSGRVNLRPWQKVELGEFFRSLRDVGIGRSGGGHKEAASCSSIPVDKLDEFKNYASHYKFITEVEHE